MLCSIVDIIPTPFTIFLVDTLFQNRFWKVEGELTWDSKKYIAIFSIASTKNPMTLQQQQPE
jgi:hypothetical protein